MAHYIALARKWRPAQFSDIVGQAHIVRTLTNSVQTERVHHAYVFTGGRGIGKTSMARIFAKVLRCPFTRVEDNLLRSCDQCPDCLEIAAGNSVNVIEIDGASNNGVEAVREIRDHARYMPSHGSRKIYLIDEVHMLTTAAFNALLKTLEEPPSHVLFIFATTEPHKIPPTILSRCQRFDYRRVTLQQIQTRLAQILAAENISAETGVPALIARAADGSLRDALSILDQVIAFSGTHITVSHIRDCVGMIDGQTLIGILAGVFKHKPLDAISFVETAYQQGHDLRVLTRGLIEFLHAVLLAKIGTEKLPPGLEISEDEWTELRTLIELRSLEEMELFFQVLHQGLDWIARSPQPKIVLSVLLIKCATSESLFYIDKIEPPVKTASSSQRGSPLPNVGAPMPAPPKLSEPMEIERPSPTPKLATAAPPTAPRPVGALTPDQFIQHVRKTRPLLASILEHAHCSIDLQMASQQSVPFLVSFTPQDAYFREQLLSKAYTEQLSQLAKDFFGKHVQFKIELNDTGESMASKKERELKKRMEQVRERAQNHPTIVEAKSLFGGDLAPIDVREEQHANLTT